MSLHSSRIMLLIAVAIAFVAIALTLIFIYVPFSSTRTTYTTSATTSSQKYVELRVAPDIAQKLKDLCGYGKNVAVFVYLKHRMSEKDAQKIVNTLSKALQRFGNVSQIHACILDVRSFARIANLTVPNYLFYPRLYLFLEGYIDRALLEQHVLINVSNVLVLNPGILLQLLSDLGTLYTIPPIVELDKMPSIDGDPIYGDPHARFVLFIYEDAWCPYCAWFYNATLPQIEKNLVENGTLCIVLKNFIVHPQVHDMHVLIQAAYLATNNATAYHELFKELYHDFWSSVVRNTGWKPDESYVKGLISKYFNTDSRELEPYLDEAKKIVDRDTEEAKAVGVIGTPGFVLWDREKGYGYVFVGFQRYDAIIKILNALRASS